MVGKYKLIGGLIGSAAASYGGYEIYNRFGPSFATASNSEGEPRTEEIEEEPNKDLLSQEKQLEDAIEDNVAKKPEIPKPEEKLDPQVPVATDIEKPNQQPQLPTEKSKEDRGRQNSNDYMKKWHLNEDGTIKIFPNTLGSTKFKGDVITASKEDKVWERKVHVGQQDLEYHNRLKKDKKEYRNPVPNEFLPRKNQNADAENLQRMCSNSYRKKTGDDLSSLKNTYNKLETMRRYWTLVWEYCGQPSKETPSYGYKG